MRTRILAALAIALVTVPLLLVSACAGDATKDYSQTSKANASACGGSGCHDAQVSAQASSPHADAGCSLCHPDTGDAHRKSPKTVIAATDWRIESCAGCHKEEAATFRYDDNAQAGPFGGSIRVPPQPKVKTFPEYNTIIAGHPFTRDYNEEGAHAWAFQDHYQTLRGKFDVCMQCKSTKIAWAWKNAKTLRVSSDTTVTLTHTATGTVPAKVVLIPKGTTIAYATDTKTRQVNAKATFPDGTVYTSHPKPTDDATTTYNMMWATTVAATMETWPYGTSCSHCHDPHTAMVTYVRQAMVQSVEGTGGVKGGGTVNPYQPGATKDLSQATLKDQRILVCSQCHVEYTCGKSSVDGIERDAFGWAKAKDLHEEYTNVFAYRQDWTQKIIGKPLIKSQHPETELYWSSVHYDAGASCADCHMPLVTSEDGRQFRSHWFTSPYKYEDAKYAVPFAQATGVKPASVPKPCTLCHADREALGIQQQQAFFARQGTVEAKLAQSVGLLGQIKAVTDAGGSVDASGYAGALTAHRKAHVLWENIAVSENSMGFHNFEEAMASMDAAETELGTAIAAENALLGK